MKNLKILSKESLHLLIHFYNNYYKGNASCSFIFFKLSPAISNFMLSLKLRKE